MSAAFVTGLEAVLYGLGPAWHVVGDDRERLVSVCREWIAEALAKDNDQDDGWAVSRAIWILDRLLPRDEVEGFRELSEVGRWNEGLFALARRSPDVLRDVAPEEFQRKYVAMLGAWVDSQPDDALLDWYDLCRTHGWRVDHADFDGLAITEYCHRAPKRDRLLAFESNASKFTRGIVLDHLLREAAGRLEKTDEPVEDLGPRLRAAGLDDVGEVWQRLVTESPSHRKGAAYIVWIEQRGVEDLETLLDAESEVAYRPTERLARIAPKDRFDLWDSALRVGMRGNYPIRRFCEWLDPMYRDLLLPHCERDDREWAACAFHAYLSMLPEGLVEQLTDNRPPWQNAAIDRLLHAPDELKPPPYVTDVQETEQDFRLYDPFNIRSY